MTPSRRLGVAVLAVTALIVMASCSHSGSISTTPPTRTTPDSFRVAMETSRGPVTMMINRNWAPVGVDRFYTLVRIHYYDGARFYRVVPKFVAQFGLAASPKETGIFKSQMIADDSVRHSNTRGTISFARGGRASRTAQLFFNLVDNARLDLDSGFGFPPIGRVTNGMQAVDSLTSEYNGKMPRAVQDSITLQGNAYLIRAFPRLDFIKTMKITKEWK